MPGYRGPDPSKRPDEYPETERTYTNLPGDIISRGDTEIISVPVKIGQSIHPGDIVDFDGEYAKVADPYTFNRTNGYGVCVNHEYGSSSAGNNKDEAGMIQIVTGNAYVVCTASESFPPFVQLKLDRRGSSILGMKEGKKIDAGNRLANGSANFRNVSRNPPNPTSIADTINEIIAYNKKIVGRYYGTPDNINNPVPSTAGKPIVVRLGMD